MQYYDGNNDGQIDSIEIGSMMSDVYRALNKDYRPSGTDIVQFSRVITRRDLARVTDKDITEICLKNHSSGKEEAPKRAKWIEDRLDVARRLFKMIDSDGSGFITEEEVPMLLIETYKQMGVEYRPTSEDVSSWMQMADTDKDG
jgi:Ca2+-binding EF-hand superfamily protein